MDISKIINNIPKDSLELLKDALNNFDRTHDIKYAEIAIAILENFDDSPDVRDLIRTLKKR